MKMSTSAQEKEEDAELQLLEACNYGDEQLVRRILTRGAVNVDYVEPKTNDCALLIATRHKHWNIARLLLQTNEVKVETDEQTKTPLMYAAIAGNYEIVVRLLGAGADVNRRDNKKETALMFACRGKFLQVIDTLLCVASPALVNAANTRHQTALHESAKQRDVAAVTSLMAWGADHCAHDVYGNTPLMYACQLGSYSCAAFLLSPDTLNRVNAAGRTALHLAAAAKHDAVARLLLFSGSEVDGRDKDGNTALLAAIGQTDGEVTALLLLNHDEHREQEDIATDATMKDAGKDAEKMYGQEDTTPGKDVIAVAGRLNRTPLHYACLFGYRKAFDAIVRRLNARQDCDACLNAVDAHGATPLSQAVQGGDATIVEDLLRLNCRPQDSASSFSLVRVAWRDHGPPMLPMLLSQGAAPFHRCRVDLPTLECVAFHERRRTAVQTLRFHARLALRRALPSGGEFSRRVGSLGLPAKLERYVHFHEYVYC